MLPTTNVIQYLRKAGKSGISKVTFAATVNGWCMKNEFNLISVILN